jgi:hypothetical protein
VGSHPRPGLAQLRPAQGRLDAASAAIRRAADGAQDLVTRAQVLAAYVEIVVDSHRRGRPGSLSLGVLEAVDCFVAGDDGVVAEFGAGLAVADQEGAAVQFDQ